MLIKPPGARGVIYNAPFDITGDELLECLKDYRVTKIKRFKQSKDTWLIDTKIVVVIVIIVIAGYEQYMAIPFKHMQILQYSTTRKSERPKIKSLPKTDDTVAESLCSTSNKKIKIIIIIIQF